MNSSISNDIIRLSKIAHLQDSLSVKQQIELVQKISQDPSGLTELLDLLINRRLKQIESLQYIDGIIFKYLCRSATIRQKEVVSKYFRKGVVELESSSNIDYTPLYESLISNNFKAANQLTQKYLSILAGLQDSKRRQWLYFTDVLNFPVEDLKTIDTLWKIYSAGQFGFSIQRQMWIYSDKNWERFWHKIGWKINKKNIRYPSEFTWDTTAPTGHLPLFNQLRGVQVLAALFTHPALKEEKNQP